VTAKLSLDVGRCVANYADGPSLERSDCDCQRSRTFWFSPLCGEDASLWGDSTVCVDGAWSLDRLVCDCSKTTLRAK